MFAMIEATLPHLPAGKPRYLMGVGLPHDLVEAVTAGLTCSTASSPPATPANGTLFTHQGRLRIRNAGYAEDYRPVEEACPCQTCQQYPRAYLRHLFQTNEILGLRLATYHNLHFFLSLMRTMRQAIIAGNFPTWQAQFLAGYQN